MSSLSDLSVEITLDILSRLPAKTVGQCRCVSMQWRALLTRPEFIMTHLLRSRILHQESLTYLDCHFGFWYAPLTNAHKVFDKITMSTTILFSTDFRNLRSVVASCNGLILAKGIVGKSFVVNPIIREIRQVPPPPLDCLNYHHLTWGFGYDSVNDDCKAVVISFHRMSFVNGVRPMNNPEIFVHVYSLRSGSWKRVQSSPCNHLKSNDVAGVFVDGRIHWIAYDDKDHKQAIAAFDLVEEKFSLVPPPCLIEGAIISARKFRLDVLGGCLCLLIDTNTEKSVWLMKEYDASESWTKFTINGPELCPGQTELMCALGHGVVLWKDHAKKWVLYNVKEGTLKDLLLDDMVAVRLHNVRFVESLVSPYGWWWQ